METTGRLRPLRLPNQQTVLQLNAAETSLQYRKIVTERMYLQHGIALAPGSTVIDVGANVGIAALFFHWEAPGTRVYAVEPAAEMYAALEDNLRRHRVDHVALNQALGPSVAQRRLTVYPNNTSMSSVYADHDTDRAVTRTYLSNTGLREADVEDLMTGLHTSYEQPCTVTTLSHVIDEYGIATVDLLKLNVEKAEAEVLAGIREEHWPRLRQLTVQVHDIAGRVDELREVLRLRGYRYVTVTQDPLLTRTDIFDLFAHR